LSDFFTIEAPTDGMYKEKGSKFIAHAFPLMSKDDTSHYLNELKKRYFDARHHCYAWVHGLEDQTWRANDDGEPSHSAGDPILGQLRSYKLTNTLVVVVRYFGGTKLGVGGLINAYKTASHLALEKASTVQLFEKKRLVLEFDYAQMSMVEKLITDFELDVERKYDQKCRVNGWIKKDQMDHFQLLTKDLFNIKIVIDP